MPTIVLRFRDLVTEEGGTVSEHRDMINARGFAWWGWWMRQYETPPRDLFAQLRMTLDAGTEPTGFLFDTGRGRVFSCRFADLRVAPPGMTIGPPDLAASPDYYQRGRYPAWFKLTAIDDADFAALSWRYAAFPSNPEHPANADVVGQPVISLDDMRNTDTTLWVVEQEERA